MKYVYSFNEEKNKFSCNKFGKKGSYLLEATNLGLPVPSGFIISTDACNQFYKDNKSINIDILAEINSNIVKLETLTGRKFGNINNPLLVAIKCSSKNEIPSLMDTILNVGLTEGIVKNLSNNTNDFLWLWKCYFNLINDYAKIIIGVSLEYFQTIQDILKNKFDVTIDELTVISSKLKEEYFFKTKTKFPDDSFKQLYSIIEFALNSWNNKKSSIYRNDAGLEFSDGLSVCIQSMVLGNCSQKSGTGVIYTRDPIVGDKIYFGDFVKQSLYVSEDVNTYVDLDKSLFAIEFAKEYETLKDICNKLEQYYNDMVKICFVIENNNLFITQVSKGKRTTAAALKIACEIADEQESMCLSDGNNSLKKINKFESK